MIVGLFCPPASLIPGADMTAVSAKATSDLTGNTMRHRQEPGELGGGAAGLQELQDRRVPPAVVSLTTGTVAQQHTRAFQSACCSILVLALIGLSLSASSRHFLIYWLPPRTAGSCLLRPVTPSATLSNMRPGDKTTTPTWRRTLFQHSRWNYSVQLWSRLIIPPSSEQILNVYSTRIVK